MPVRACFSTTVIYCLIAGFCLALAACSTPIPKPPTFEVALNKNVRMSLPLALFEDAVIFDTFGVRFHNGATLTLSAMTTSVDIDYMEDISILPEYMLGLRDIDTEGLQPHQLEELVGMREMDRRHVGEGVQPEVFETPRGKVYALIGQSKAIAYFTFTDSRDVLLSVNAINMHPDAFRNLIKGNWEQ